MNSKTKKRMKNRLKNQGIKSPPNELFLQVKMRLAKQILAALGFIFLLVAAAKIFVPNDNANAVWDFSTYVLPNLVSLITGFLFGSKGFL